MTPVHRLPPGLYGMADTAWGDPMAQTRLLVDAGCRVVQLRAKDTDTATRTALARRMAALLRGRGVLLVVNDDIAAARASGADGVHLGQDDAPLAQARAALGPRALIGRSTHDLDQVRAAQDANYLGFGPVFPTTSKRDPGAARGTEMLARAVAASSRPVVAIGGIDLDGLAAVVASGAHSWAVISGIFGAADPAAAARAFVAAAPTAVPAKKNVIT